MGTNNINVILYVAGAALYGVGMYAMGRIDGKTAERRSWNIAMHELLNELDKTIKTLEAKRTKNEEA